MELKSLEAKRKMAEAGIDLGKQLMAGSIASVVAGVYVWGGNDKNIEAMTLMYIIAVCQTLLAAIVFRGNVKKYDETYNVNN